MGADGGELDALAGSLRSRGFDVLRATTADEALRSVRHFQCAVFLDLEHPNAALSLAGWLLAEGRIGSVVFRRPGKQSVFPQDRATNLGRVLPPGFSVAAVVAAVSSTNRTLRSMSTGCTDAWHRGSPPSDESADQAPDSGVTALTAQKGGVRWQRGLAPQVRRGPCA